MTTTRAWLALLATLALGACGSPPPGSAPGSAASTVTPTPTATVEQQAPPLQVVSPTMARYDGYADMRFGMDETAFRKAWKGELQGHSGQVCFYLWPKWVKVPADFAFMFEHGKFVRYDVGTTKQTAPGGGKVGMTAARIHALYPDVTEQPHKYEAGGTYLRVENPGRSEERRVGKEWRWRG